MGRLQLASHSKMLGRFLFALRVTLKSIVIIFTQVFTPFFHSIQSLPLMADETDYFQ